MVASSSIDYQGPIRMDIDRVQDAEGKDAKGKGKKGKGYQKGKEDDQRGKGQRQRERPER